MAIVNARAAGARASRRTGTPGTARILSRRLFWPFLLPALVLYLLFLIAPTVATAVLSFTSWAGAGDTPSFIGAKQYTQLVTDEAFLDSFVNTIVYVVAGGVGTFVLAFLFAIVLREMRGNKIIRAILFFPNIVAPIALGMFMGIVFKYDGGLANNALKLVGVSPLMFLKDTNVTWVVMFSLMWASSGFYLTILMAAVDGVPPYLYEDADLGGATPWQKFRDITLPLTWDVVGICGVLWTISAVKIFELIFVLAGPGTYSPPIKTWTLGLYVWDRSFGTQGTPQYGAACAVGVVMIVLVTVLVVLLQRIMRRDAIQY